MPRLRLDVVGRVSAPMVTILEGHVLDHLRELPDAFVHCVVTSPPYWGLRDYSKCECVVDYNRDRDQSAGIEHPLPQRADGVLRQRDPDPSCPKCHGTGKDNSLEVVWDAKVGCEHEWGDRLPPAKAGPGNAPGDFSTSSLTNPQRQNRMARPSSAGAFCRLCGAWHGQLGLEPTPELYVQHIVQVFREVKRVLRDDGTLWLNMGDCYNSHPGSISGYGLWSGLTNPEYQAEKGSVNLRSGIPGFKPKDLIGIPWRVAFALQADGWYLRSDIIWAKPNPMPESVTDRPTKAHEYVFLLSKSARYFYDADAVRETYAKSSLERINYPLSGSKSLEGVDWKVRAEGWKDRFEKKGGHNLRTVWTISTQPYPEAHFATFPEALAERCIKAGTSEKGCCGVCGAAWERIVDAKPNPSKADFDSDSREWAQSSKSLHRNPGGVYRESKTLGFRPTCDHAGEPVPCVVLDPFGGSGTTGAVARRFGRDAILIEIKSQYVELAKARTMPKWVPPMALDIFSDEWEL